MSIETTTTTAGRAPAAVRFGGIPLRNTRNVLSRDTRLCHLLIADGKLGKTTLAASLDALTRETLGKPSLFIAVEQGEGGGTMSVQDAGVDYVCPETQAEFDAILAELSSDSKYGGVILDSGTEAINRIIKPYALTFPSRERHAVRTMGVPDRGDYQSMGEFMRQRVNRLIDLTVKRDLRLRKHFVMTTRLREKVDQDSGAITFIGPDLPGALAQNIVGMFQTVSRIVSKASVEDVGGKKLRVTKRVLLSRPDSVTPLGDRMKVFPEELPLTKDDGSFVGYLDIWKQYWLPRIEEIEAAGGVPAETQAGA